MPLQKSSVDESVVYTWFAPELGASASTQVREPWEAHPGVGTGAIGTFDLTSTGDFKATISANEGGSGIEVIGVSSPSSINIVSGPDSSCKSEYNDTTATFSVTCANVLQGVIVTASEMRPRMK